MHPSSRTPDQQPARRSRTLVLVMLGIIILSIAAFLVFRPDPSGAGTSSTPSQHQ